MEKPFLVTSENYDTQFYVEHNGLLVPKGGKLLIPAYPRRLGRFPAYLFPAIDEDLLFGIGDEKRDEVIRAAFTIASAQAGIITYMPVVSVNQVPEEIYITREGRFGSKTTTEKVTSAVMDFITRED